MYKSGHINTGKSVLGCIETYLVVLLPTSALSPRCPSCWARLPTTVPRRVPLSVMEDSSGPLPLRVRNLLEGVLGNGWGCGEQWGLHSVAVLVGDVVELSRSSVGEGKSGERVIGLLFSKVFEKVCNRW